MLEYYAGLVQEPDAQNLQSVIQFFCSQSSDRLECKKKKKQSLVFKIFW